MSGIYFFAQCGKYPEEPIHEREKEGVGKRETE
jgi:hypothetical protein